MLDNAIKYENELKEKFMDRWYDDYYKYFFANTWHSEYEVPKDDWKDRCFVSLDVDNNIIGYISYSINRNTNSAYDFAAINFTKENNAIFGMDLHKVIKDIFFKFNMNRIEFTVVIGNPIEYIYDKMIARYGGRIIGIKRESIKLIDNYLYDEKLYEILRQDYIDTKYSIPIIKFQKYN